MKKIVLGALGVGACALSFIGGMMFVEPHTVAVVKQVAAPDSNVRLVKNQDGTRDVYVRSEDGRTIDKYRLGTAGENDLARFIYRLDEGGKVLSSKIFNPAGEEMFKISYGYHRDNGMLVEERMFDSRKKRLDENGKELPVQRLMHLVGGETVPIVLDEKVGAGLQLAPFHNPFVN